MQLSNRQREMSEFGASTTEVEFEHRRMAMKYFVLNALSFIRILIVLLRWREAPRKSVLPAERLVGAVRHPRALAWASSTVAFPTAPAAPETITD